MIRIFLILLLLISPAYAVTQQTTIPYGVTTPDNESSTISVTSTFQQVFGTSTGRTSCTIQNNGTHTMYVYFNSDTATTAKSVNLAAGQSTTCGDGNGVVIKNTVQITGTSGDAYYAVQW